MDQYLSLASQERECVSPAKKTEEERTSQDKRSKLRIVVDLNRCQSYAQCCFLAPDVFRLHGEEAVTYYPEPDASKHEEVIRAAASCPVRAITVEICDKSTGELKGGR